MREKIEIQKNRLDLAYQRNLQLLNVIFIIGAGSFVMYLAGLILDFSKLFNCTLILIMLFFITFILYNHIDNKLKEISLEIKKLN